MKLNTVQFRLYNNNNNNNNNKTKSITKIKEKRLIIHITFYLSVFQDLQKNFFLSNLVNHQSHIE